MYDNPFYIYTSNHPLVLLKQIPLSINDRLSDMSYEKIFNKVKKKKILWNETKKNTGFPAQHKTEQKHSIEKDMF